MNPIKIIDYRPEHQPYFDKFNRKWIQELFEMEPVDEWVLTNPSKAILETGGAILMAEYLGNIAGTVGLRKMDEHTFEFTKMAVDENFRRRGIAEALSYASFEKAKEMGAKKVILYSNTLNAAAIKLYEKLGFVHVPVENDVYERANVKMEIELSNLHHSHDSESAELSELPLSIMRADASHAAAITTIGKKSFRNAFEPLFHSREELFEYLEYTYDPVKLARSLRKENNIYLLAWHEGEAVGFVKIKKHSLNELIESGAQMELQKIYVLPSYAGKGVGSALLNRTLQLAQEIGPDFIWLDTHISNKRAIRFYERNGFRKIGDHLFTIGRQTFAYYVMGIQVTANIAVSA